MKNKSTLINDGNMHWTTDYRAFKKLKGNRDVKTYRALKKSMKEHGMYPIPIIVNEKGEIIDGQHRVICAEELGLPIPYIVREGLTIDDCLTMNSTQNHWVMNDRIKSFADRGYENYIRLTKLIEEYKEFPWKSIVAISIYGTEPTIGHTQNVVKEGKFEFVCPEAEVREILDTLKPFIAFVVDGHRGNRAGRVDNFVAALIFCIYIKKISAKSLLKAFEEYAELPENKIGKVASTPHALLMISNIYNYGKHRKKLNLALDWEIYLRTREK